VDPFFQKGKNGFLFLIEKCGMLRRNSNLGQVLKGNGKTKILAVADRIHPSLYDYFDKKRFSKRKS